MSIQIIKNAISSHLDVINNLNDELLFDIEKVARLMISSFGKGKKILVCGNGGSAGDAQHFCAELVGRFVKERKGLPAIALTTDTSALTAIANDYSFEIIFERQVEALASEGDILLAISTSGNSSNVLKAVRVANKMGCTTVSLLGHDGGEISKFCDYNLIVPSKITARIQELHILIEHILCEIIDNSINS